MRYLALAHNSTEPKPTSLLPAARRSRPPCRVTRINDGAAVLRSALKKAVADSGKTLADRQLVQFVNVDSYFDDHRICSPDPWINGFIPQAPGEAFHPNPAGHARGYLPALTATTTKLDLTAA